MFSMVKIMFAACVAVLVAAPLTAAIAEDSSGVARMGSMSLARRLKVTACAPPLRHVEPWWWASSTRGHVGTGIGTFSTQLLASCGTACNECIESWNSAKSRFVT